MRETFDLAPAAGFPLALDREAGELRFPSPVRPLATSSRRRTELRPVLAEPDAPGPDPAYRMYRDVAAPGTREGLLRLGLRYDLTVLAPGRYGREFVKTFGHDHPERPGTGAPYPELYQVVSGSAVFLLAERRPRPEGGFRRVALVAAGPGEAVVVPPGFAHATANVGLGWLVLANWVSRAFASDYERVRAEGGLPARIVAGEGGAWRWEFNERAGAVGQVLSLAAGEVARRAGLGGLWREPVWRLGDHPARLAWLVRPEEHRAWLAACAEALAPGGGV